MNRYVVFAGEDYYPSGGMKDYVRTFPTLEEAKAYRHVPAPGEWAPPVSDWRQVAEITNAGTLRLLALWTPEQGWRDYDPATD